MHYYPGELVLGRLKPIWISLKQETVTGTGISWAVCSVHLAPDRQPKTERWGGGVVEQVADLRIYVQLMPLPLAVSCFSKIQIGFTFLVPAHPGSPGQRAVKRVCVCVLWPTVGQTDRQTDGRLTDA